MTADRSILDGASARRLKAQLLQLVDEFLLHDGWGHLELDMRILARRQKEFVIKAGREYRFVIDFQNTEETSKGVAP